MNSSASSTSAQSDIPAAPAGGYFGASFRDQRVWVCGAAGGIGHAIVAKFVAAGATVVAIDQQWSAAALSGLSELGGNCFPVSLDIADACQVAQTGTELVSRFGAPDIWVNAAGILRTGPIDQLSNDDWQACLDINVSGFFYLLRLLMPYFKQRRSGSVVAVASNAGHLPRMHMAAYGASKAALISLCQCAGLELAAYNVRCNIVSPGSTATPMLDSMLGRSAGVVARLIAGLPEQYKLGVPLQKIATPDDVANTVLFLASDLAGHITLQDIVVDGGATLGV